ncbi:Flp pilus assembly protein RcpC/CpaB [Granulicella sibirica]|uniref:Flp pilus assembly protein RcpC/CpaB n=1 Tax=Granulicella sibirica TaxID=2479048 RepID=A0A4Q0T2U6_9BACT|nr:Flp pilus assembly protein RcpC/CpaB [Granulicella sibirica]
MSAGEPVVEHSLAGNEVDSVAASVPDGMRAVSIKMSDEAAGLSGLIAVGSYLDILVSYHSDTDATFVSSMVVQNVRVLFLGRKGTPAADNTHPSDETLTLLLTPNEAARLAVAGSQGKLTFVLRNQSDKSLSSYIPQLTLAPPGSSLGRAAGKSPAPSGKKSAGQSTGAFSVETLSGGKSTVQTFQAGQP